MKQSFVFLLAVLALVGCASATKPANDKEQKQTPTNQTEQPIKHAPESPGGSNPPVGLKVGAIVVTGATGEKRYTQESKNPTLDLSGPLRLRVEVTDPSPKGGAEWYFEGSYNPLPGRQPKEARGVVSLGKGYEVEWNPGPGTQGKLWVSVWGDAGRDENSAWRSRDIYPMYPWRPVTQCPPVALAQPPAGGGGAGGSQTVADPAMNQLTISWYGETYLIPLSVNPDTCTDAAVAARLRDAKSH